MERRPLFTVTLHASPRRCAVDGRDIQISGRQIKSSAYSLRETFCLQIAPRNASLRADLRALAARKSGRATSVFHGNPSRLSCAPYGTCHIHPIFPFTDPKLPSLIDVAGM